MNIQVIFNFYLQAIKDFCFFNMGDHGGILVAVKYFKNKGETRHVMYSTDEGEKWTEQEFHHEDLRLYGLMTEPGENTTVFTMFGSTPGEHKWIIVKLDLQKVFCKYLLINYYSTLLTYRHHFFFSLQLQTRRL